MPANEKISKEQFACIISVLCQRWHISVYADYMSERYWPAFSRLDEAGQRAFWQVLGVQAESLERRAMAHITEMILYLENNYLHYDDTDIKRGFFHGNHVNQEHTIELLRLDGADEISVIVHDNDRDIPALKRLEEFAKAGYTFIPTPIEGPMTYRLRRIEKQPS
jgi:hypothetical protein